MKTQLEHYQQRIHQKLEDFLNQQRSHVPPQLQEAILYATLNKGKRLRPALVYAVAEALNTPLDKVDALAVAIELIHSYSLVHDDLPAMDDDDLRRGQPTCHIQFNEATAILVGDAQLTYAFQAITDSQLLCASEQIKAIKMLSDAAGAKGMIAGQLIDIQSEGLLPELNQLKNMHLLKTGALIKVALLLGNIGSYKTKQEPDSVLLNEDDLSLLELLGEKMGLAFQVQDDILDIESSSEILGKPQGSDEAANKSTYPKLLGLEAAKQYRDDLIADAKKLLSDLELNSRFLEQLIDYIAERRY